MLFFVNNKNAHRGNIIRFDRFDRTSSERERYPRFERNALQNPNTSARSFQGHVRFEEAVVVIFLYVRIYRIVVSDFTIVYEKITKLFGCSFRRGR